MKNLLTSPGRSPLIKVIGIGALILVLLIPLSMTRGVIHERSANAEAAHHDIMQSWGGRQVLGGPILVVPYSVERTSADRESRIVESELFLLPETLRIEATLASALRRRGLHEVPVYTAQAVISGSFAAPDPRGLGIDDAEFDWARAAFFLPVTDARAIRNAPAIAVDDRSLRLRPGGAALGSLPAHVVADVGDLLTAERRETGIDFSLDLTFGGTDRLDFLPLGDRTEVEVTSDWPSPSFGGAHLPVTHSIDEAGFKASWLISSLGRSLPGRWTARETGTLNTLAAVFGVQLFVPVGPYQLSDRATKYAVLFVGLTFVAFFLFEALAALKLHPLQYLQVGLANVLFYLMLLAISEHLSFGAAYLLSSVGATGLVGGYSSAILGGWRRASLIVAMLLVLYGFLYLTLNAEDYAMLAGSIALWTILAFIMYLTRRIDWYRWSDSAAQSDLFAGSRT